jgi:hypothetical protein
LDWNLLRKFAGMCGSKLNNKSDGLFATCMSEDDDLNGDEEVQRQLARAEVESSGTAGAREGRRSAWEDAGRRRGHAGEKLGEAERPTCCGSRGRAFLLTEGVCDRAWVAAEEARQRSELAGVEVERRAANLAMGSRRRAEPRI